MGLKSFEQHRLGLRDGREVYFEGERVADVTTHPVRGAKAHTTASPFADIVKSYLKD